MEKNLYVKANIGLVLFIYLAYLLLIYLGINKN